jgi:hypothetical protein
MLTQPPRRMKTLEQRVESLMGILATTNNQVPIQPSASPDRMQADVAATYQASGSATSLLGRNETPSSSTIPEETTEQPPVDTFRAYDPIDAGLLNETQANMQLHEFRHSFTEQFPFVVLETSRNVQILRREQPFLFLSIMASTSYRRPIIQRTLAAKFRDQVGAHISACTLQGLEILQGLLVHAAYFQYFYMPGAQHLAVIIQLSIAVAQNLGQSKYSRTAHDMGPKSKRSAADRRALLGTYYLAAL